MFFNDGSSSSKESDKFAAKHTSPLIVMNFISKNAVKVDDRIHSQLPPLFRVAYAIRYDEQPKRTTPAFTVRATTKLTIKEEERTVDKNLRH